MRAKRNKIAWNTRVTELILHIGMPKTGTTTLQGNVFAELPGFLGKDKHGRCLSGTRKEAQWLVALMERYFRYGVDNFLRSEMGRWRDHCLGLYRNRNARAETESRILLSEERLVMWPIGQGNSEKWPIRTGLRASRGDLRRLHPAPVVAFLRDTRQDLWPHGRIRVLLTLRNQPDWFASHYSQLSNRIPGASQLDFERRLEGLIREPDPFLNWWEWAESIAETVGKENTFVLPLEQIGTPQYWSRLGQLLGEERVAQHWQATAADPRNVRPKQAPDEWALRPLNMRKLLSPHYGEVKSIFSELSLKGIGRIEPILRPLSALTIDRHRDEKITLGREMRARVREVFRSGNERLSGFLQLDLSKLGY